MADMVKVKMLRAIGGFAEGDERTLSAADAKRLEARGVVRVVRAKAESAPANKMAITPANKATISAATVKAPAKRKGK